IVYPVLTLPHEITSEVFIQCLPPSPVFRMEHTETPHPSTVPLLLLQICREWRSIAIAIPQLWVHLHLDLGALCRPRGLEEFIKAWFNRAGSFPLSFSFHNSGYLEYSGMDNAPNPLDAIRATLLRYAPQLGSLALQLKSKYFQKLVAVGPFPLLERLSITLTSMEDWDAPEIFSDAPRL
ncbi:hypothetical protein FB451DRAFT_996705, partial [Mycena latifolia]